MCVGESFGVCFYFWHLGRSSVLSELHAAMCVCACVYARVYFHKHTFSLQTAHPKSLIPLDSGGAALLTADTCKRTQMKAYHYFRAWWQQFGVFSPFYSTRTRFHGSLLYVYILVLGSQMNTCHGAENLVEVCMFEGKSSFLLFLLSLSLACIFWGGVGVCFVIFHW